MSERTHSMVTILPCNNVVRSMLFYGRLGFRLVLGNEEYAILEDGKGAEIHLQPAVDGWLIPGRNPFGLYLYTEDVDDLAREFSKGPEDKSWGMYEFALSDPDETLVRIGWPTRLRAVAAAR